MATNKEEHNIDSHSEKIGFHKGCLQTLASERAELLRIVQITEALIQAHIKGLEELGVDVKAEMQKAQEESKKVKK